MRQALLVPALLLVMGQLAGCPVTNPAFGRRCGADLPACESGFTCVQALCLPDGVQLADGGPVDGGEGDGGPAGPSRPPVLFATTLVIARGADALITVHADDADTPANALHYDIVSADAVAGASISGDQLSVTAGNTDGSVTVIVDDGTGSSDTARFDVIVAMDDATRVFQPGPGDWDDTLSWGGGNLPDQNTVVRIPADARPTLNQDVVIQRIYVENGAVITMANGAVLNTNDAFIGGTFTGGSLPTLALLGGDAGGSLPDTESQGGTTFVHPTIVSDRLNISGGTAVLGDQRLIVDGVFNTLNGGSIDQSGGLLRVELGASFGGNQSNLSGGVLSLADTLAVTGDSLIADPAHTTILDAALDPSADVALLFDPASLSQLGSVRLRSRRTKLQARVAAAGLTVVERDGRIAGPGPLVVRGGLTVEKGGDLSVDSLELRGGDVSVVGAYDVQHTAVAAGLALPTDLHYRDLELLGATGGAVTLVGDPTVAGALTTDQQALTLDIGAHTLTVAGGAALLNVGLRIALGGKLDVTGPLDYAPANGSNPLTAGDIVVHSSAIAWHVVPIGQNEFGSGTSRWITAGDCILDGDPGDNTVRDFENMQVQPGKLVFGAISRAHGTVEVQGNLDVRSPGPLPTLSIGVGGRLHFAAGGTISCADAGAVLLEGGVTQCDDDGGGAVCANACITVP